MICQGKLMHNHQALQVAINENQMTIASLKRQFGHMRVRIPVLAKIKAQLVILFVLSNLWMVHKRLTSIVVQG